MQPGIGAQATLKEVKSISEGVRPTPYTCRLLNKEGFLRPHKERQKKGRLGVKKHAPSATTAR